MQALRAGADAFWAGPVAADELAARLLALGDTPDPDGYRILVVDDQPVAANFAVRVLEEAGMHARSVGDPRRVLETLEALRPDLVLMDLHMPGVDGIELTALTTPRPCLPVPGRSVQSQVNRPVTRSGARSGALDRRDLPTPIPSASRS